MKKYQVIMMFVVTIIFASLVSYGVANPMNSLNLNEETIISCPAYKYDATLGNRMSEFYYKEYAPYVSIYKCEVKPGNRYTLKVEYTGDGYYQNLMLVGENPYSTDLNKLDAPGTMSNLYGFLGSIESLKSKFTYRSNFSIDNLGNSKNLFLIAFFDNPSSYMKVTLIDPALPDEGIDASLDGGSTWGTAYNEPLRLSEEKKTLKLTIGSEWMDVNGSAIKMDTSPILVEGRTVLPLKIIGDQLGATVAWDPGDKKITYTTELVVIELWVGKKVAWVNGKEVPLDVAPFLKNNRTLVPLKFVSENLGAKVAWDPTKKVVTIIK